MEKESKAHLEKDGPFLLPYPVIVLKDKLSELDRDYFFIPNAVLSQRRKQLTIAIKALSEGCGYIGPCQHNNGLKFIRYNDADAE